MVLDGAYRQNFKTTINLLLHFAVANTKEDRFVAPGRHWAPRSGTENSKIFSAVELYGQRPVVSSPAMSSERTTEAVVPLDDDPCDRRRRRERSRLA